MEKLLLTINRLQEVSERYIHLEEEYRDKRKTARYKRLHELYYRNIKDLRQKISILTNSNIIRVTGTELVKVKNSNLKEAKKVEIFYQGLSEKEVGLVLSFDHPNLMAPELEIIATNKCLPLKK